MGKTIPIRKDVYKKLEAKAKQEGVTVNEYAAKLLLEMMSIEMPKDAKYPEPKTVVSK